MTLIATCHCGSTRLVLARVPDSATECNCTYCSKTGGIWGYFTPDEVEIVVLAEGGIYAPTHPRQRHFFCTVCGCTTHGIAPAYTEADIGATEMPKADQIGVNLRLLDNFDLSSVELHKIDGRNLW